jgi:anti-anti-sigma regulatory factor
MKIAQGVFGFLGLFMLMITRSEGSDLTRTIKLEGKLLGSWIAELESACRESLVAPERVCLDLCDLTYVDAAGARFLVRLIHDGARVVACSGFVAEMIHLNDR